MVGHGGSSAASYLADPTSPIPSHCASIVATSAVRVNFYFECKLCMSHSCVIYSVQTVTFELSGGAIGLTLFMQSLDLYNIYIKLQSAVVFHCSVLTLKVLVTTIGAQWEGMGDVMSARYEPALLPPCSTIRVLSYSN